MLCHADETQLRELLSEALMLICRNAVVFEEQIAVKALIGLTVDKVQVSMIDFSNILYKSQLTESPLSKGNKKTDAIYAIDDASEGRIGGQPNLQSLNTSELSQGKNRGESVINSKKKSTRPGDGDRPKDIIGLLSEVEQLAERVEHRITKKAMKIEKVDEKDKDWDKKDQLKNPEYQAKLQTRHHDEVESDTEVFEPCISTPLRTVNSAELFPLSSAVVTDHPQSEDSKIKNQKFFPILEEHTEWVYEDEFGNYGHEKSGNTLLMNKSSHVDNKNGIQKVIVGSQFIENDNAAIGETMSEVVISENIGEAVEVQLISPPSSADHRGAEYEGLPDDEEEQVLVMTSMEAEAQGTLNLMPGETFEYNGTTYQVAAEEPIGNMDSIAPAKKLKLEPAVDDEIVVRRGNHTHSKKPKKYLCSLCSQRFTTHWGLKLHERLHKGDFRYHCKICNEGFTSTGNVKGHMVKHGHQKEFACEYCGKMFGYRQSLERHQTKNSNAPCRGLKKGRKPYMQKTVNDENDDGNPLKMWPSEGMVVEVEPIEVIA